MNGPIDDIYQEQYIPNGFSCDQVFFTENVRWNDYNIMIGSTNHIENVCEKIGNLEYKWNRTCVDVLCQSNDNLNSLMQFSNSSIVEWINACQYCGNNSIIFRDLVRRRECNANNQIIQKVIDNFPTSMQFCGTAEYGIPLLFNNSKSNTGDLSKNEFSYYCACSTNDYYQPKCLTDDDIQNTEIGIRALLESVVIGEFFIGLFIVFIPKLVYTIKTRGSPFHMITISYTMIKLLVESVFFMFAVVLSPKNGISQIVPTIMDCLNIILLLALFSWLGRWTRKVLTIFNKKKLIYSLLIYGIPFLASLLGVSIPIVMLVVIPKERVLTKVYFLNGFSLAVLVFVVFGFIIGRALKKVSDVSIWKTPYAKYLLFVTIIYVVFCISIALGLGLRNDSSLKQGIDLFSSFILLLVTGSLLYVEFELEELKFCYPCCVRKSKSSSSDNQSPFIQPHTSSNTSTTDYYYSEITTGN